MFQGHAEERTAAPKRACPGSCGQAGQKGNSLLLDARHDARPASRDLAGRALIGWTGDKHL